MDVKLGGEEIVKVVLFNEGVVFGRETRNGLQRKNAEELSDGIYERWAIVLVVGGRRLESGDVGIEVIREIPDAGGI